MRAIVDGNELNDEYSDHEDEIDDYFSKERYDKYKGYNGWSE